MNLPKLLDAAGASYVARWTTYHVKQMERAMLELLRKNGFGFLEIISQCPTLYQRRNGMGDGLEAVKFYKEHSKVNNNASLDDLAMDKVGDIICGKFVDRDRPEYGKSLRDFYAAKLGPKYRAPEWRDGVLL
jgi:2-oxoglutarate ferredoxin oxidoreductase subunit beta